MLTPYKTLKYPSKFAILDFEISKYVQMMKVYQIVFLTALFDCWAPGTVE